MQTVNRALAARLNPFISSVDPQDTLDHVAGFMRSLGELPQNTEKPGRLFLVAAAALEYEAVHYERP